MVEQSFSHGLIMTFQCAGVYGTEVLILSLTTSTRLTDTRPVSSLMTEREFRGVRAKTHATVLAPNASARYRLRHPERIPETKARYRQKHPVEFGYSCLRRGAKATGRECTITLAEYRALRSKLCFYCRGSLPAQGHGLDRSNPAKGYTPDNVRPCCRLCNTAKSDQTAQEFTEWMVRLHDYWSATGWNA